MVRLALGVLEFRRRLSFLHEPSPSIPLPARGQILPLPSVQRYLTSRGFTSRNAPPFFSARSRMNFWPLSAKYATALIGVFLLAPFWDSSTCFRIWPGVVPLGSPSET